MKATYTGRHREYGRAPEICLIAHQPEKRPKAGHCQRLKAGGIRIESHHQRADSGIEQLPRARAW